MNTAALQLKTLYLLCRELNDDFSEQIQAIEPVTTLRTPARPVQPISARRSKNDQLQFDFEDEAI